MFNRSVALVICAVLVSSITAQAQFNGQDGPTPTTTSSRRDSKLSLSVQGGYSFGAFIRTYDGEITLPGSPWVGGAIDYDLKQGIMLEVSYMYRTSDVIYNTYNGYNPGLTDNLGMLSTHYIQIGSLKSFRKGKVAPFIGGNLGVAIYSPEQANYDSDVFFTVSGLGGAKVYISDNLGIRLQGRLLLPIFFGSIGFYCGGGGCGSGVSGTGTVEGELSGGLFLDL